LGPLTGILGHQAVVKHDQHSLAKHGPVLVLMKQPLELAVQRRQEPRS